MRIVISQPMLFPWIGMLEQVRLADVFVHYDDVQYSKGSFVNRVQIKSPNGLQWMTVPIRGLHLGQRINELKFPLVPTWQSRHLTLLKTSLGSTPFASDVLNLVEDVYAHKHHNIGELSKASFCALCRYFGLDASTQFLNISDLATPGSGSNRVLDIVRKLNGSTYVTGHGGTRYLEHEKFERAQIHVEYMAYSHVPYSQSHGEFTPYVSALDLVAHCGTAGAKYISSKSIPWRQFLNESS